MIIYKKWYNIKINTINWNKSGNSWLDDLDMLHYGTLKSSKLKIFKTKMSFLWSYFYFYVSVVYAGFLNIIVKFMVLYSLSLLENLKVYYRSFQVWSITFDLWDLCSYMKYSETLKSFCNLSLFQN